MPLWPSKRSSVEKAVIEHGPQGPRYLEIAHQSLTWYHIDSPGDTEQEWLREKFQFHPLDLEDVLSVTQRPKLDEYDNYLFLVLHFPVWNRLLQRLNSGEIDIFVGDNFLITITIAERKISALETLIEEARSSADKRSELMEQGSGYLLYRIVDLLFDRCFPMLNHLGHKIDKVEEQIFDNPSNDIVRDISQIKQELITFRRTMRPQRSVVTGLEKVKRFESEGSELEYYFSDVADAAGRIWDVLESYREVIDALQETNESVVSHRLNSILRILTAFSVIMLPLTLLASIWGMNVHIPGQNGSHTFSIIVAVMLATLLATVAVFRRKGWL